MYKSTCQQSHEIECPPHPSLFRSVSDTAKSVYESVTMPSLEEDEPDLKQLVRAQSVPLEPVAAKGKGERSSTASRRIRRKRVIKALRYTEEDMEAIVDQEESFQLMKEALRNKGCVTNLFLQQNIHHYVYHLKKRQLSHHQSQEAERNDTTPVKERQCRQRNKNIRNPAA